MTAVAIASSVCLGAGVALLLSLLPSLSRPSLTDRLLPYVPAGASGRRRGRGPLSLRSFRDVLAPLATSVGDRVARAFGVGEELAVRLERVHSALDSSAFRSRQVGWSVGAAGFAAVTSAALQMPAAVALLFVGGAPLLAFLAVEQQLARQAAAWQQRIFAELPVVCEQLGMLLAAGYSLGGALNRLARRGRGACGRDLNAVCGRIGQGLGEIDALREWAAVAKVDALDRLVTVLALNRETGDLGRLVSDEARAIRRDAHRQLVELIDRRAQQVWIPVTVATLLPGVIFLVIPFLEAMRLYTNS